MKQGTYSLGDVQAYDVSAVDAQVSPPSARIYIDTTGPVEVVMADTGRVVVIPGLLGGMFHDLRVKQINAAGTTALTVYVGR